MLYSGNIVKIMLGILLVFSIASPVLAETSDAVKHNAGIQAERGVKNVLFGWTDIPRSIIETTANTKNPVWGLAAGTFNGIGRAFPRTVSGIADIVTLPAAHCDDKLVKPDELNTQIR
jgi:putative exosortase-associated protein (TIGR04073 family)